MPQFGPPETTFQLVTGSQASVLPVPPLPVESRVIVEVAPTSATKKSLLLSVSPASWSGVVKKTFEPSEVIPLKMTPLAESTTCTEFGLLPTCM